VVEIDKQEWLGKFSHAKRIKEEAEARGQELHRGEEL
jgi:hypothetical protein